MQIKTRTDYRQSLSIILAQAILIQATEPRHSSFPLKHSMMQEVPGELPHHFISSSNLGARCASHH
jgi:hypothetical protein